MNTKHSHDEQKQSSIHGSSLCVQTIFKTHMVVFSVRSRAQCHVSTLFWLITTKVVNFVFREITWHTKDVKPNTVQLLSAWSSLIVSACHFCGMCTAISTTEVANFWPREVFSIFKHCTGVRNLPGIFSYMCLVPFLEILRLQELHLVLDWGKSPPPKKTYLKRNIFLHTWNGQNVNLIRSKSICQIGILNA